MSFKEMLRKAAKVFVIMVLLLLPLIAGIVCMSNAAVGFEKFIGIAVIVETVGIAVFLCIRDWKRSRSDAGESE